MSRRRLRDALRDAGDVLRHARPRELARAVLPASLRGVRVRNDGGPADPGAADADAGAGGDALARLAALRRRLQAEVLDDIGRAVDYRRLADSDAYAELEATSRALATAPLATMLPDDAARIAFWINVYNVLTVHGVVALGVRTSVMEIPTFFGRVAYRVGGHVLTLDDIEMGVLRRNSPHPVSKRRLFAADDPRLALAPSRLDPRIHAALVCGARGCPPVSMYDPARLDDQLDMASEALCGGVELDATARQLRLPLVLRWYAADFGGEDGVVAWVTRHAGDRRDAIAQARADGWSVAYLRYDWSLNGTAPT
ncbi:MAG: DUF547 domain-containing protein [Kofleriaceae bacterium]|nr:DUF547 domain-containing protein [Kofleriaceae bacterium]